MKKLTAIMLVLIMLASAISLSSCNTVVPEPEEEKITTKTVYNNMMENTGKLDAYEAKIDMETNMAVSGQDVSVKTTMEYVVKVDGIKSDSPTGYAEIKMDALGQPVEAVSYAEGDYIYITAMGENFKLPKDNELASDYNASEVISVYEIDVPESILSTTEYTVDADGNYVLSFAFNDEHRAVLDDFVNNILGGMELSLSEFDLSLGEVKYTLIVDKTFMPKSMKLDMTMSVTTQGVTMEADVSVNGEYLAFDDAVTITPPEGYKNYPEIGDQ